MNEPADLDEFPGIYEHLDANKVLTAFGKYGRFQMRTYFISNTVNLLYALNMMILPFISEAPVFDCAIDESPATPWNYTKVDACHIFDENNQTISCLEIPSASYKYEARKSSLAAEFDLVCDRQGSVAHGASMFLLGGLLVAPVIMQLSDIYGRRPTFLYPFYISIAANLVCILAPNYIIFLAGRFVSGIAHTSFCTIGMTLALESVSVKFRSLLPILYNVFWVSGYLLAGLLKLYINDWRWLLFAASVPALFTLPLYPLLPESLHWLLTMRKFEEAKKYIETCSRINKKQIDLPACQSLCNTAAPENTQRTIIDIFKSPVLFISLLVNGYIFIVLSFTYWALSLYSTDLAADKMTGFFLSGLIEIPGAIIANVLINFLGRKTVSIIALLFQSLSMVGLLLTPSGSPLLIFYPLVTKCFTVVMSSNQILHTSELTPTSVRNVFVGVVGFLRDIGGVMAPYLKIVAAWEPRAPSFIIAVLTMSSIVMVLLLPETRDKELPEDIHDADPGPILGKCLAGPKSEEINLVDDISSEEFKSSEE